MKLSGAAVRGNVSLGAMLLLSACGGDGGGSASSAPAAVSLSVSPQTVIQGQAAVLTWSSNAPNCTASGAWSGAQASSGSLTVTPTALGDNSFGITCEGGAYASKSAMTVLGVSAASVFSKSNLVSSDGSVPAAQHDSLLLNPWGVAASPISTLWAANSGSNAATLYDGTGLVQNLIVHVPAGANGNSNPTGIVFNETAADFVVAAEGRSGGSLFIFAGDNGTLSGWSSTVFGTQAVIAHESLDGAVFRGLALAKNGADNLLYTTDFKDNKVAVFDRAFTATSVPGDFADSTLPGGFAPFGIQALQIGGETRLVVTYAKQDGGKRNAVPGAGLGLVNVFDTNGVLVKHLVAAGGALNAPWGIALAPPEWGTLGGKLLIGSTGSGQINAYDPLTGDVAGTVNGSAGEPLVTLGLRGLSFGNGVHNQPKLTLYFFAAIEEGAGGLYGRVDLGGAAPDIVAPTVHILAPAPASAITGSVAISVDASDDTGIVQVEYFAGTASIGASTTAPFSFDWDSTSVANGNVNLSARAKDAAGNLSISPVVAITVAN